MKKTLSELREGTRQRADMEHDSGAVSDDEVNQYVNESYHELYDLITAADEARLFAVNATIPPQVGEHSFLLPGNFYRMVSVHVRRSNRYVAAIPADPSRYAELADDATPNAPPKYFIRWDIDTGLRTVFVFPATSPESLAITYWPQPSELATDSDSLDNPASWLEFVMVGAAIRMLNKVERDSTAQLLAKRTLGKRIQQAVYGTDFNYPRVVRDLAYRGRGDDWSW